jgi:hypothetical protein
MKNMTKLLSITVVLGIIFLLSSCNPIEDDSKSSSLLTIESLRGQDAEGMETDYLQSDVTKNGTIYADVAVATLRASTLDPAPMLGASQYNDIVLDRYTVTYSRTDGKNTPGVDVPLSFEGSLTALIKADSTVSVSFIVVRDVAKLEPPLVALADGGAEGVLTCVAKIDFYGHDLINNKVTATGYLTIYFANYVD